MHVIAKKRVFQIALILLRHEQKRDRKIESIEDLSDEQIGMPVGSITKFRSLLLGAPEEKIEWMQSVALAIIKAKYRKKGKLFSFKELQKKAGIRLQEFLKEKGVTELESALFVNFLAKEFTEEYFAESAKLIVKLEEEVSVF